MIRANCFRLDIVLQRHHTSLGDISAHSLCVFSDFHTFYCIVVVTLDGIQASIVANNASIVNLEASVDTLVTETISGLKNTIEIDIAASEATNLEARNNLEAVFEGKLGANSDALSEAQSGINALNAEINKADSCGKAGKLYTKDGGCKTIEIPDTNLLKYTGKGCTSGSTGALEFHTIGYVFLRRTTPPSQKKKKKKERKNHVCSRSRKPSLLTSLVLPALPR